MDDSWRNRMFFSAMLVLVSARIIFSFGRNLADLSTILYCVNYFKFLFMQDKSK